ncbi:MAG: phage recombination protein Bet [Burkholderiales bacterium]|nr:phage recombination protein Bet [Burkholderiales bacterium]
MSKSQTTTAPPTLGAPGADALPEPVARRGLNEAQWRTLKGSLFPGASNDSILMAVDYCKARQLDVMKKPCHIVPMNVRDAKTGSYGWRDVILPGIYEYRITAHRTGLYMGRSAFKYGPIEPYLDIDAPSWCEVSVYRWSDRAKEKMEFCVRVVFSEVANTKKDKQTGKLSLNEKWSKSPTQMLTKCAEAAALREAFPDELGGEATAEEMEGRVIDITAQPVSTKPKTTAPQARAAASTAPADLLPPTEEELFGQLRNVLDFAGVPESELLEKFDVAGTGLESFPATKIPDALIWLNSLHAG